MLADEQIEEIAKPFISDVGDHWCKSMAIPDNGRVEDFARAIEAEVRKQDTELIRQMLEALEGVHTGEHQGGVDEAIAAAKQRLGPA